MVYKLICRKHNHFVSAQMVELRSLLQMFLVLGMHNFDVCINAWEKRKDGLGINVNKNQDAKKLFKLGHAL